MRKEARVLLVLDVSGSMGEFAGSDNETKLDLAKAAASSALDEFKDTDQVGLWVFSTDLGGEHPNWREVVPIGEISENRADLAAAIDRQIPVSGTPLYEVTGVAYETMLDQYDPAMINAVVLLTDGINDDGDGDRRRRTVHRADRAPCRPAAKGRARGRSACSRSPTVTLPT